MNDKLTHSHALPERLRDEMFEVVDDEVQRSRTKHVLALVPTLPMWIARSAA